MLNEPILGLLPATEEEIVSVNRRVSPDSILRRLRRLERASVVKRRKDGKYVPFKRPQDEDAEAVRGRRKNPVNRSQLKRRTCTVCGVTHTGIYENFGYKNGKVCNTCRENGHNPTEARRLSKVCVSCGEEKHGLKKNFRQTSIAGSNGRVKVYRDICKACEGRRVTEATK